MFFYLLPAAHCFLYRSLKTTTIAVSRVSSYHRLKVQGFKSLRELDLELSAFNVLIGANGAEKSNLLSFFQMLNFAFGASTGNLPNYVKAEGPAL